MLIGHLLGVNVKTYYALGFILLSRYYFTETLNLIAFVSSDYIVNKTNRINPNIYLGIYEPIKNNLL